MSSETAADLPGQREHRSGGLLTDIGLDNMLFIENIAGNQVQAKMPPFTTDLKVNQRVHVIFRIVKVVFGRGSVPRGVGGEGASRIIGVNVAENSDARGPVA